MIITATSSATKNFFLEGPVNQVVSHLRRLESDCSFCYFLAVEN